MSLEMVKENILLKNKVGKESSQLLLEGDIIVPDVKPDISEILRVDGRVFLDEEKVSDDRVSFQGELKLLLIYNAKKSEKLVHSMTASIPIADFINIEGIDSSSQVTLTTKIDHLEYKIINDRKVNIKAVVTVTAFVHKEVNCQIIKDIFDMPNIQAMKGNMMINNTVENKKDRFTVKEEFNVSAGKPNIREVLQCDIAIGDKELRAMDGKVLVKGNLLISVLYVGDNDESLVEVMEYEVPFNGFIEAKNSTENMLVNGKLSIDNQYVQVVPDKDGEDRGVEVEATVGVNMNVVSNENINLVEDAYAINKNLEIQREKILYPEFVCKNKNKSSIKETITIDGKYDDIMQVVKVWGDVTLDSVKLVDDKLIAEGVVNLEMMYIAKNDSSPVNVIPIAIPFEQEIEVKGARDYMNVDASVDIENIAFNMLSEREVEIRTALGFDVFVTKDMDGNIITEILCNDDGKEEFENFASAVIYVVQKGDTLWNIAKRYNTTVDDLVLLNEIENPDKIYHGQKILVLKKVYE